MDSYKKRYNSLNTAQQAAVDTIDGPVMVVAGPGTGKTELLSVRVANILRSTDTLPQNILCLTFTESGARAMRERLQTLIGNEANKVAIYTFHAFGSEIISSYGEYFYEGASFEAASDITSFEVIEPILAKLPPRSKLNAILDGKYTYLSDIQSTIGQLKKGGLSPDELEKVLDANEKFLDWSKNTISDVFSRTVTKKQFPDIAKLLKTLRSYEESTVELFNYQSLRDVITESLQIALEEAEAENSTKPITAWKSAHTKKDTAKNTVLKASEQLPKLKELVHVYRGYLRGMEERGLYDYDDMILRVVQALEHHDELRYQLQETYQYILVDEFQDTNDVQMRLLWNLTNSSLSEGRPNVMVVGDDDQAIYRFQGANLSNVLDFTATYTDPTIVSLKDNYRSDASILATARSVITQADERLETLLPQLDKTLSPHQTPDQPVVKQLSFSSTSQMRSEISKQIMKDYKHDALKSRAVIARNHRQLQALLPHLLEKGLPIKYEHDENILESEPVQQLLLLSEIVSSYAGQKIDEAEALLPELLSHPAWGLSAHMIWSISIQAYRQQTTWIEVMLERQDTARLIAEWLLEATQKSLYEPLERMIDHLFGDSADYAPDSGYDELEPFKESVDEGYSSPLKSYFFPKELLDTKPAQYLTYLSNMRTLRETVRSYKPGEQLRLKDLLDCIQVHKDLELSIRSVSEINQDDSAITLLTAHKSKGLEFDTVYILDASEEVWGSRAKKRSSKISFPENLPLQPAGETDDERLRLLYVAITRAKEQLYILHAKENDADKPQAPIGALETALIETEEIPLSKTNEQIDAVKADWRQIHFDTALSTKEQLLAPLLEKYKLSATHVNNFIDVTSGGPQQFMLSNLLHFPQAMHPSAAYGSAVHKSLQFAHQHLSATGELKPIEDVTGDFAQILSNYRLTQDEYEMLLDRGQSALAAFLTAKYPTFDKSQQVEHTFSHETVMLGDARLTGAIDLIDIDKQTKTIRVTDYKTGKAFSEWKGSSQFDKIKLHKYEQQLLFYKLLIENSRHFQGYTVTSAALSFVEPNELGEIVTLEYSYDEEKLKLFSTLIQSVWNRIMNLNFDYDVIKAESIKDIIAFESELIEGVESID